jgi:flavodoxin
MKKILLFFLISLISFSQPTEPSKILIIYFSRTGNTEKFANYIKEINEKISEYKIEPASPYTEDYNTMLNIAQEEQKSNARPEINNILNNVSDYDVILLGYPIWYSHIPNIVITQLEKLDLNGKTIYPFNTHLGSGTGNSINEIKSYATNANVMDGFPINMNDISNRTSSMEKIKNWLEQIIGEENNENQGTEEKENNKSIFKKINHYLFYIICILLY